LPSSGEWDTLDYFQTTKQSILEAVIRLRSLAEKMGNDSAAKHLSQIDRKLSKEHLYLTVLGHFKRGKSTLINALLGMPLLPTGIVPLTSVITKVQYGEQKEATVFFKNGASKVVDTEELGEYITEKGNPSNQKNVAEVEVKVPSKYSRDGVIFIDTPGVGSTYLSNTSVTYNFMSKIDAAIFVLAVDPPISQGELEFLKDIKEQVHKVFFLQNKIDYVSENEWLEAVDFSKSIIRNHLDLNSVDVHPISAKSALEAKIEGNEEKLKQSRLPEFEHELGDFLMRGRIQLVVDSAVKNILKITSDMATALELRHKSLQMPIEELESKTTWLKSEVEKTTRRMRETEYLIDGGVKEIMDQFDSELTAFKKKMEPELLAKLADFLRGIDWKTGSREAAGGVEEFTRQLIMGCYRPFMAEQDTTITKAYDTIIRRFEDEVDMRIDEVKRQASKIFDIKVQSHASGRGLTRESRFYFHIDSVFGSDTMLLGELPFFLPKPLFKKTLQSKARENILMELDKNGGRIRSDFLYRLMESIRRLKGDVTSRMSTTLEAINNAIDSAYQIKKQVTESQEAELRRIKELETELQSIRSTLIPIEASSQKDLRIAHA